MCSFSAAQWYKPDLHTPYSSRDGAVVSLFIQYYIRIMFDRLEENGEEQLHLENYDLYCCVAEKLHIAVMSASWFQSGVSSVHTKTWPIIEGETWSTFQ